MTRAGGFALVPALLLLLFGIVVIQGVVEVALVFRSGAAAWGEGLHAEAAAAGATRAASLGHPQLRAMTVGDTLTLFRRALRSGATARALARRLSAETFVIEGSGVPPVGAGGRRLGRTAWRPDGVTRASRVVAVIETGLGATVQAGSRLDASSWLRTPPGGQASQCTVPLARLAAVGAAPVLPSAPMGPGSRPRLGPLDAQALVGMVTPVPPATTVSPTPVVQGGACVAGGGNWGSPRSPLGPCGARFVSVGSPGSLSVQGGEGQGLLVVQGDLTLEAGVFFSGVVVVEGSLNVRSGARFDGFGFVGGSVAVSGGSQILGSACAGIRALEGATQRWGPSYLPDGGWLEPY